MIIKINRNRQRGYYDYYYKKKSVRTKTYAWSVMVNIPSYIFIK